MTTATPSNPEMGDQEPLLGRPGDASQADGRPLYHNLIIGTAPIAQFGIVLLVALVFTVVLLSSLSTQLFALHPLFNVSALLFLTEAIIILQPTHTAGQKRAGTLVHSGLNGVAALGFIAAFTVIFYNKASHGAAHFTSVHGVMGLITYIVLLVQALIGFTQYFVPQLYGGVENAKSLYKWHRLSGYLLLILILATIAAATQTPTVENALGLKLWSVIVLSVLILVGVLPRVKKQKFGLVPKPSGAFGQ